jgi:hypothetical protein
LPAAPAQTATARRRSGSSIHYQETAFIGFEKSQSTAWN